MLEDEKSTNDVPEAKGEKEKQPSSDSSRSAEGDAALAAACDAYSKTPRAKML